ncbi:hypothetical protein BV22DRAFT_1044493 [Leucogyrophana mollusca]|uniref:Uncharacterized protein n=1 Tax=Leucogyrophana mollusca TaxID=85980 RepID=A0ACB8BUH8_9AGAM|nr:hypothetical protein BV22DRAFT_1044493 [Leucogyrophana mollusca]
MTVSPPPEPNPGYVEYKRRDETFYFTTVVFLVEGVLFRVPRHPFADGSDVFRQMFQLPIPDGNGNEADGCSDDRPLRLELIRENDFRQLLKALFPDHRRSQKMPKTFSEWRSVLKLSAMWEFESAKKLAVDHMSPMAIDPVDKICLARDYDVQQWLVPALNALVKRKEPIGMKDAERLGMELALKVAAIREGVTYTHQSYPLQIGERQVAHLDFTNAIDAMLVHTTLASP